MLTVGTHVQTADDIELQGTNVLLPLCVVLWSGHVDGVIIMPMHTHAGPFNSVMIAWIVGCHRRKRIVNLKTSKNRKKNQRKKRRRKRGMML